MNTFELLALLKERYDCWNIVGVTNGRFEGIIEDILDSEPLQVDYYQFEKYESRLYKMGVYSFIFLVNNSYIFAIIAHGAVGGIGVVRGLLP